MTRITELYKENILVGFKLDGHANYSIPGRDIVCAAISAITINTINSITEIGNVNPMVSEDDGYIVYCIKEMNTITNILLWAAKIGYRDIAEQYPNNAVIE